MSRESIAKHVNDIGWERLEEGIRYFLAANGRMTYDESLTKKIGHFILSLTNETPTIPLEGKKMRDLSSKQRVLFQADEYEGSTDTEFLGHWVHKSEFFFLFSRKTVKVSTRTLTRPSPQYKTVARLCHERPDPVVSYDKIAAAVPRFLRDMQGSMKYMSVDREFQFENAHEPQWDGHVWFRTAPVNVLLSILDHQDMHVHVGRGHVVIYNRWFGAYFEGE